MTNCSCDTRGYVYVTTCQQCEVRHLARLMPDHRRLALTAHRKTHTEAEHAEYREQVAREYALDHPKEGKA